ncbi:serine/threonine protein kinase [Comamonas granuli]|uniref:serine/threonine protein kinase n=1 Tax=Comamonas granuli TaxID=290309 RepID=UPI0005A5D49C|nr:serine/threonine-protein kinase [Comamonas granuli]
MTEPAQHLPSAAGVHVDALPVGTRLGEFEILALLGVGGFGMVYKAFDHSLHRAVAIKEFMPAALATRGPDGALHTRSPADQPAFRAGLNSFVGEARLLAQFDHPSLVKVFRFWEANHTAYMVMPLYSGMTFKQARAQMRTPPPEAWLRKLLWCILGALRVLHNGQTLHRDISPDNIFLQDFGPPVLLDLGAARHAINDRDRKHTAVLKVNYAPIEQYAEGDPELVQGPWSDLYSLGAVVHGCLCNDTPLPSTLRSIRDRMVPFARVAKTVKRQFGQEYSPAFVEAISQALSLRPQDRPQSIDAFLQLMDMTTPPGGLELFDFRAELGDIWVEPTDQPGPGIVVPTVDLTAEVMDKLKQPAPAVPAPAAPAAAAQAADGPDTVALDGGDTVLLEEVVDSSLLDAEPVGEAQIPPGTRRYGLESERERPSRPSSAHHRGAHRAAARPQPGRGSGARGARLWLALAAVSLAAAGAYAWRGQAERSAPARAEDIITEMAVPASAPPAPAASAASAVAELPAPPASADVAQAVAEPASAPAPAFVPASDPRAASRAAPRRRVVAAVPPPAAEPPSPPPAPPPPAPVPAPPPPPKPAPVVRLCEGETVLTRSMCLREQCRKAGNAALPACVEFRRQMEPLENRQLAN